MIFPFLITVPEPAMKFSLLSHKIVPGKIVSLIKLQYVVNFRLKFSTQFSMSFKNVFDDLSSESEEFDELEVSDEYNEESFTDFLKEYVII